MSGMNDDNRKLSEEEAAYEIDKYSDAVNDLWELDDYDKHSFHDTHLCIAAEVHDLDNPYESDEGIEKGELHKRNRMRFASGVFKAFFDEKIIDEKTYDQLFKNLRENLMKNYQNKYRQTSNIIEEWTELRREGGEFFEQMLRKGIMLRSGRFLPSNDQEDRISERDSDSEGSD